VIIKKNATEDKFKLNIFSDKITVFGNVSFLDFLETEYHYAPRLASTSACQMLELQVCATMPGSKNIFFNSAIK
jgi:hypothetical protein